MKRKIMVILRLLVRFYSCPNISVNLWSLEQNL